MCAFHGLHSHTSAIGDNNLRCFLSCKERPSHSVIKNKKEKSRLLLTLAVGKGSQTGSERVSWSPEENFRWGSSHSAGGEVKRDPSSHLVASCGVLSYQARERKVAKEGEPRLEV